MGFCFDDEIDKETCEGNCNDCYLVNHDDIQCYGRGNKYISFDKKAFSQFEAHEEGEKNSCSTTHYFFLGTECDSACDKIVYEDEVYYLQRADYDDEVNFLYAYTSEKFNKKVTMDEWNSKGQPGTWKKIYMLCADHLHRGPP